MKNSCIICAHPADAAPVCPVCILKVPFISGNICRICGTGLISEDELCIKCRTEKYNFAVNRSLFYYFGIVPLLVRNLKNAKNRSVIDWFAMLIASLFSEYSDRDRIIVPVPARPENLRKRGYDQMDLVAGAISRKFGIPCCRCLKRTGGKSQKMLGKEERKENIKGAIRIYPAKNVKYPVLVDDVFTTGATLNECASVLLENGALEVKCITIARD